MAQRSLYEILGVSRDASQEDIKKSFRKLARAHHPDVNPGDADAERRFKEIGAAYDVLGDEEKRKLYDEFGEASLSSGFDPERARAYKAWQQQPRGAGAGFPGGAEGFGGGGYEGFGGAEGFGRPDLDELFGDLLRGRRRGPRPGRDVHASLALDFLTAARGGQMGLQLGDRSVQVRIPPGIYDGETIRLRGQGEPGAAGAGDLLVTVHIGPHPVFRRDALDLHVDVPITVGEAVRGGKVEVPTLDGSVTMTVPPSSQSGRVMRLRGKGIARRGERGELYATLQVRVPDRVDGEVLDRIDAAYSEDVRAELRAAGVGG
jgi:curved DNA-binding protein